MRFKAHVLPPHACHLCHLAPPTTAPAAARCACDASARACRHRSHAVQRQTSPLLLYTRKKMRWDPWRVEAVNDQNTRYHSSRCDSILIYCTWLNAMALHKNYVEANIILADSNDAFCRVFFVVSFLPSSCNTVPRSSTNVRQTFHCMLWLPENALKVSRFVVCDQMHDSLDAWR